MNYCLECGKETTNPKFCSRSCSARYNNKKRKKIQKFCIICGALVGEGTECRKKYCDECRPNNVDWDNMTLGELKQKRKYQVHSRIRDLARKKVIDLPRFQKCSECGYTNHIEVCHIKAISEYSDDTTLQVINNINNLVGLCPNHHWELDHNILPFNPEWMK